MDVTFDANKEIRRLVRDFRKLPPDLRKELRPALRKAALPILADSRNRSSWSTRIPRATRISTKFQARRGGVVIAVSGKRAPHARPYEHLGSAGTFRHPVFGNRDVWVPQAARPFLFNAVDAGADGVREALGDLVVTIGRKHGWDR